MTNRKDQVMRVKRLEWNESDSDPDERPMWTADIFLGHSYQVSQYTAQEWSAELRDNDSSCCEWPWAADKVPLSWCTLTAAQKACQDHFEAMILSTLETPENSIRKATHNGE